MSQSLFRRAPSRSHTRISRNRHQARRGDINIRTLMVEPLESRLLLATNVPGGPVAGVWDLAGSPYRLTGGAYVETGTVLTIEPGVTVESPSGYTLEYKLGSNGSITSSFFTSAVLKLSSAAVSVSGTTFTGSDPVITTPSLVTELPDNTFAGSGTSSIHVSGTTTVSAAWTVMGTARQYVLDNTTTIAAGTELTIGAGVEVATTNYRMLYIDGTVHAGGSAFAGWTRAVVHSGGRLDLDGLTALDADYLEYQLGSAGTIKDSHFDSAQLRHYSNLANVSINGCTFTNTDPVVTYPSLVPDLTDNTFAGSGTSSIHVWGTTTASAAWTVMGTARQYVLDNTTTIAAGTELTIGAGVEVATTDYRMLYIDGTVRAGGSAFAGWTRAVVHSGGRLDLDGLTKLDADYLEYQLGSAGTIKDSHFDSAQLRHYSNLANVSINGCTFTNTDPVVTYPSLVPDLTDNTFAGSGTSSIHVSGTTTASAAWTVMGTARQYVLDNTTTIAAGTELTIGAGVEVATTDYRMLYIDGTVRAGGSAFHGWTRAVVHNGGRLDLDGLTKLDADYLEYQLGSAGTIKDSHFDSAQLRHYSNLANVSINGCTFTNTDPVVTYPSLVPDLTDNTFAGSGTSSIHVWGTTTASAAWTVMGTARQYVLDNTTTIAAGTELTIGAGVEVATTNYRMLYIDGTVRAGGSAFAGWTRAVVHSGGRLDLDGLTKLDADYLEYQLGSFGTIKDSHFDSAQLRHYSNLANVSINGCTFTNTDPVVTYPSLVPDLTDNTFAGSGTSSIHVWGTTTASAAWTVMGTARQYVLDNTTTIAAGTELTIGVGVEVATTDYRMLYIDGTARAGGSAFQGWTRAVVRPGGRLDLYGATKLDADYLEYQMGSFGTISNSHFDLRLRIHSDAFVEAHNNDFAAGHIEAVGDPADTIDLRWNWWGSTDPVVIGNKITDRLDDATRPLVLIEPWLTVPPNWVPTIVDIVDVAPDPRESSVAKITIIFSRPVRGFDVYDLQLTRNGGDNVLTGAQVLSTDNDMVWTLSGLSDITDDAGDYTLFLDASESGIYDPRDQYLTGDAVETWRLNASMSDRMVFYNHSYFDQNNAAPNENDDLAAAADKQVLLPGGTATFANYTSYDKGINGLMIDVRHLADTPTVDDFLFRTGNDNKPYGTNLDDPADDWLWAPAPTSITVRAGAGADGTDRITLIWPDGAIRNCWLQVTVLATEATGLPANDVFYVGNAVGESGNSLTDAVVNATDEIGARNNPHGPFTPTQLTDPYDFNRDRLVNATDQIISRNNRTSPFTALKLIRPPLEQGGSGEGEGEWGGDMWDFGADSSLVDSDSLLHNAGRDESLGDPSPTIETNSIEVSGTSARWLANGNGLFAPLPVSSAGARRIRETSQRLSKPQARTPAVVWSQGILDDQGSVGSVQEAQWRELTQPIDAVPGSCDRRLERTLDEALRELLVEWE